MSVLAKSWSASIDLRRLAYAAAGVFLAVLGVLHWGFYQHNLILDTIEYHRYGDLMNHGQVPYRDFGVEYPPGALPVFALPAIGHPSFRVYHREFQALMALCGIGALVAMAVALRSVGASVGRAAAALGFAALAPLVLGSIVLYRYDLWPTALAVAGLAGVLAGRQRLGFAALGLGIAAKVFPAALVPPALAYVWRRSGRREALLCLAAAAAVAGACVIPFLALAPHGVWRSVVDQTTRPLQIESLGSAVLVTAHQFGGLGLAVVSSHGSQNLAGSRVDAAGQIESVVLVVALLAVWAAAVLGPAQPERLVRYAVASVIAFVAFSKVLSPQFMIWLIPLVPLVRGRRGIAASALLGLALLLTQLWFPIRYWRLVFNLDDGLWFVVLLRDLVLVALLAVLVWPPKATLAVPSPGRAGSARTSD
ncbi:MAG TPA: glycosyltransferase 87 family protein [Gaiellaceae bacterium]|nr:glycosyltransferase 87 family protein [Gaiellaceae bacterium]